MRFLKPIRLVILFSFIVFIWVTGIRTAHAETVSKPYPATLNLFWGNGCPHCAEEEKFLKKIQPDYPTLVVRRFEVWGSAKNRDIFKKVAEKLGVEVQGVPFTVVGNQSVGGYLNDQTTGEQIKQYINNCLDKECPDVVAEITGVPSPKPIPPVKPPAPKEDPWKNAPSSLPREVNFPVIGRVNLTTLSIPAIAIVIGTLDGFNPCAMWVLLFLISLLVNLKDRKRMWLLGSTFLISSGLVYFLFMVAWLNILLFIGFIALIRLAIAVFAIIAGAFSLNKYYQHKMGCIAEKDEQRKKTFEKLKKITYDKSLLVALLGIAALAFAVNLVELLCSAGFPAIFTQILALNKLSPVQHYLYIGLYILFFMLDDIIVFFIAMKTLETTGISTKYAKYSNLIGGLLMILIGALLIFKPQYLMFNF